MLDGNTTRDAYACLIGVRSSGGFIVQWARRDRDWLARTLVRYG